jgi:hypothetical protein
LVEGLWYISESEYPFEIHELSAADTSAALAQIGLADAQHKDTAAAFWQKLAQVKDWFGEDDKALASRYASLADFFHRHLPNAQYMRKGNTEVQIALIGQAADGKFYALTTKAIET